MRALLCLSVAFGVILGLSGCAGYKIRPVELEYPEDTSWLHYAEPEVVTTHATPDPTPIAIGLIVYEEQVDIRQLGAEVSMDVTTGDGTLLAHNGQNFGIWNVHQGARMACHEDVGGAELCLHDTTRQGRFEYAISMSPTEVMTATLQSPIPYKLINDYDGGPDRRRHIRQIGIVSIEQSTVMLALVRNFYPRLLDQQRFEVIEQAEVIVGADKPTQISVDGVTLSFTHPLGEAISVRTEGQFLPWVDWFENGRAVAVENQVSRFSRR
ncbi:MAG: hypothetical protein AAGF15_00775 [Pseudomonadota bacterium]